MDDKKYMLEMCRNFLIPDLTDEERNRITRSAHYALTADPNKEVREEMDRLRDSIALLNSQLNGYRKALHDKEVEIRVLRSLLK